MTTTSASSPSLGAEVAGALERAGEALGVVDVHLTAERAHFVGAERWPSAACAAGEGAIVVGAEDGVGHDACHSTSRGCDRSAAGALTGCGDGCGRADSAVQTTAMRHEHDDDEPAGTAQSPTIARSMP